ncbi:MAG TPA: mechanosensitive ion channel [Firmicutes bacterium]|nr:mechanosensitive ion channel [Bacillota bacterium]
MSEVWYSDALTQITQVVSKVPVTILVLIVGAGAIRIVKSIIGRAAAVTRMDPTLGTLLQSVVTFAGWVLILTAATASLGLQQVSLALGGSIALVAMALASSVNAVTQDLLAGVFLIGDKDFKVGYTIRTGSIEGVVEAVGIRKTKIRAKDGILHTVPNRLIDNATYELLNRSEGNEADQESEDSVQTA